MEYHPLITISSFVLYEASVYLPLDCDNMTNCLGKVYLIFFIRDKIIYLPFLIQM